MPKLVTVKVRKVGTSLGILIPMDTIRKADIEEGDEIEIAVMEHKKDLSGYGIAKDFPVMFVRDKKTRYL